MNVSTIQQTLEVEIDADPTPPTTPWRPWCGDAVDTPVRLVDFAFIMYAAALLLTGATAMYKVATYSGYILALAFVPTLLQLRAWRISREVVLSMAMVAFFVLSALNARFNAWVATWYLFQIYLMFWAIVIRCDSFPRFKAMLLAAFWGAMAVAIAGVVVGSAAVEGGSERQIGITEQSNAYGFILAGGAFSSFLLFHMASRLFRWILIVSWVVILVAMAGSGSRQVFVGICGMIAVYSILEWILNIRSNVRNVLVGAILLGVMGVILFFHLADSALTQRLAGTRLGAEGRYQLLIMSLDMFRDNPLLGVGPGGMAVYTRFVYTHNTYTELLATTGVFAFALYCLILGSLWMRLRQCRRWFASIPRLRRLFSAMMAVLAGYVVLGLFHLTHASKIDTLFLAIMVGLCAGVTRSIRGIADTESSGPWPPE